MIGAAILLAAVAFVAFKAGQIHEVMRTARRLVNDPEFAAEMQWAAARREWRSS